MSQSLSSCCVSGHIHDGTPKGKVEQIGGVSTYASPSSDGSKAKTVFFITDIFGYELPNVRILADEFAQNGFYVVVPDLFDGDYVDQGLLKALIPQLSDPEPGLVEGGIEKAKVAASLGPWVARHREAVSRPIIEKFLGALKADPEIKKIGAVGFCWGGRYSILLASDNDYAHHVDAAVGNHPSFLAVPDEVDPVNKPVLIQVGDHDAMMSVDHIEQTKKAWAGKSNAEVTVFPGAVHGFSVRGDQNNDQEKKHKDESAEGAIKFLQKYLA